MIQNPILRGFCPDPSIIRVGEDYYIATSTFEWWPGVKLFHSKDLKNWEQIPSPLRRESQLNMIGNPTSGGVWAPCLSYDGNYYYLVYTDVKTKKGRYYNTHNYLVYTDNIYGEWSEPIYLNSIGFDSSLFHDLDGKKYLINMVNGFKGILVQEIEPCTWKLIGERKKVYNGSGIGCTEGPHMYNIGDWYYIIAAEGGTGLSHCVTMARSKSVWGPFETAPNNPILTSNQLDTTALQKCGHADFTDTQDGEWYMVHLCSRPLSGLKWSVLGRETAIQKMCFDKDGWFLLEDGGKYAYTDVTEPLQDVRKVVPNNNLRYDITETFISIDISETKCIINHDVVMNIEAISFFDDFNQEKLDIRYVSPRASYETFADCKLRTGYVRLIGQESMNSLHHVSLLAVRQQEVYARAETAMEFTPDYPEQLAGLTYMYDAMNFYIFGKTVTEGGQAVLTLIKSDAGVITDEIEPIRIDKVGLVRLRAVIAKDGLAVNYAYCIGDGEWQEVGGLFSNEILTDEHCRGFTGAHFGMYIHDMTGLGYYADFEYFSIQYNVD